MSMSVGNGSVMRSFVTWRAKKTEED